MLLNASLDPPSCLDRKKSAGTIFPILQILLIGLHRFLYYRIGLNLKLPKDSLLALKLCRLSVNVPAADLDCGFQIAAFLELFRLLVLYGFLL